MPLGHIQQGKGHDVGPGCTRGITHPCWIAFGSLMGSWKPSLVRRGPGTPCKDWCHRYPILEENGWLDECVVVEYSPLNRGFVLGFPLKMSKWFGFNKGTSAPPQVLQMKKPVMCNGCVWRCAEPQGPGVNITWQCEKGGGGAKIKKVLLIPYSSLPPVTDKAGGFGRWKDDFPRGEREASLQCDGWSWRDRDICTQGEAAKSKDGAKWGSIMKVFSCRHPRPIRSGWTARKMFHTLSMKSIK